MIRRDGSEWPGPSNATWRWGIAHAVSTIRRTQPLPHSPLRCNGRGGAADRRARRSPTHATAGGALHRLDRGFTRSRLLLTNAKSERFIRVPLLRGAEASVPGSPQICIPRGPSSRNTCFRFSSLCAGSWSRETVSSGSPCKSVLCGALQCSGSSGALASGDSLSGVGVRNLLGTRHRDDVPTDRGRLRFSDPAEIAYFFRTTRQSLTPDGRSFIGQRRRKGSCCTYGPSRSSISNWGTSFVPKGGKRKAARDGWWP